MTRRAAVLLSFLLWLLIIWGISACFGQTPAERLGAELTGRGKSGPAIVSWSPQSPRIGYGFAALVDRTSDAGATPWTVLTVGAQINATNGPGVNQVAFGIATEAWALAGSRSYLVGIEATAINLEPTNDLRKIAYWATFKNRPDYQYVTAPPQAMNVDSQALRIESIPGTGFERGIVFAPESLHASVAQPFPVAIDYKQVDLERFKTWALERYPDNWCLFYSGRGQFTTRECN